VLYAIPSRDAIAAQPNVIHDIRLCGLNRRRIDDLRALGTAIRQQSAGQIIGDLIPY
jgi:hypothetical protein